MNDVTQILHAIHRGDRHAAGELLPLIYDELRKLAARKLASESPRQTLQATALVHEAYVRLVSGSEPQDWDGRGHFFAAAAEAMRRILIESARRKLRLKHGGEFDRIELTSNIVDATDDPERLLELDTALTKLAAEDATAAEVVKLHFFTGMSLDEVGAVLGMSRATAYRQWSYARSWLKCEIEGNS
ncbi:MAG: sigma-70 family RNA polymerase sigma factor [Planctomycetes bacterium]|nr:sigma-70 family RNA polymerase sigma factor [Planctomycetota bacterium]